VSEHDKIAQVCDEHRKGLLTHGDLISTLLVNFKIADLTEFAMDEWRKTDEALLACAKDLGLNLQ